MYIPGRVRPLGTNHFMETSPGTRKIHRVLKDMQRNDGLCTAGVGISTKGGRIREIQEGRNIYTSFEVESFDSEGSIILFSYTCSLAVCMVF